MRLNAVRTTTHSSPGSKGGEIRVLQCPVLFEGETETEIHVRLRPRLRNADRICTLIVIVAVIWLLIEVLPAFFDGRVAQAVR